jgi:hypothetical protein
MKKITLHCTVLSAILLVGLIMQSGYASAQQDSITRVKLDSLIKLSNHQIKLLDPKKTQEYLSLQENLKTVQGQNQTLTSERSSLNTKIKEVADENLKLLSNFADCRLSHDQVEDITAWSQANGLAISSSLSRTIEISKKFDEIDVLFTKSPDKATLIKISENLQYFNQNLELVNQKAQIYKDLSRYKIVISDYFKCLQEFDTICKEITLKLDNSTISDIVREFKRDLSSYPYLRAAFYFASEFSAPYGDSENFFWFYYNDVQIPQK